MNVRVVARQGEAALVEWEDALGLHRAILPANSISTEMPFEQLQAGIPYGVQWETLALGEGLAQRLAQELRGRGIWTRDDLQKNMAQARAAFQAACALEFTRLIDGARRQQGGTHE